MSVPRQLGPSSRLRARARRNHTYLMPDTAQIMRPGAPVPSTDFGFTQTFVLQDIVSAAYWSISGQEALVLERLDVRAQVTVALPFDSDITEHDEIVYTEAETLQIHHFSVVFVHDRTTPHSVRAACEEYKFTQ